jgi:hypothetical protein
MRGVKKDGKQSGRQRYQCRFCGHRFQYKKREKILKQKLWSEYTHGKQTLIELGEKHNRTSWWVRNKLDEHNISTPKDITPQTTIIVPDTTFWGRSYGVCVFRSWNLKRNIWWNEVPGEKVAHYYYGRKILEERGWVFTAAVVDGRRGLATVFKDIPVQICHFHQMKNVTKYLTRRPETLAGQELRSIMLTLPKANEKEFTKLLSDWHKQWKDFINEKTKVLGTKHWYYTHKKVRSAYKSLETNLSYLFTYQKYPELNIPNTTNTIDGYFASVKKKVAQHHGLRKDRRYKVISELLNKS